MPCFVYTIQSKKDGSYHTGSSQDLDERGERHNQGRSKDTKAKRPWQLMYWEKHQNRPAVMKQERESKARKSKDYIESLVRTSRQD